MSILTAVKPRPLNQLGHCHQQPLGCDHWWVSHGRGTLLTILHSLLRTVPIGWCFLLVDDNSRVQLATAMRSTHYYLTCLKHQPENNQHLVFVYILGINGHYKTSAGDMWWVYWLHVTDSVFLRANAGCADPHGSWLYENLGFGLSLIAV